MVGFQMIRFSHIAISVAVWLVLDGCAAERVEPAVLAVSYESPRPWGFGWSVVLLQDGLAAVQTEAEEIKYVRVAHNDTDRIFQLAQQVMEYQLAMSNVVDAPGGRIVVYTHAGRDHALWDELVMPNYGFTTRSLQHRFDGAREFVSAWTRFTTDLAGAISVAPRANEPEQIDARSEQVLRTTVARWEASRQWWEELMERAIRTRQVPIDSP